MKIKVKKNKNIPVIKIYGDVIGEDVRKISEKITSFIDSDITTIIIDLTEVNVIDSNGLGMFVFTWKLFNSQSKKMLFYNPNGFVKNLFESSNLNKVFTITNTLEGL
jgi:anti-sigma B factor antagonist